MHIPASQQVILHWSTWAQASQNRVRCSSLARRPRPLLVMDLKQLGGQSKVDTGSDSKSCPSPFCLQPREEGQCPSPDVVVTGLGGQGRVNAPQFSLGEGVRASGRHNEQLSVALGRSWARWGPAVH